MPLNLAFLLFLLQTLPVTFAYQNADMASVKKAITPNSKTSDKAEVRKVINEFYAALCKKDVNSMMSHYAPDVIVYDVKPPFQTKGAVAWRHTWEACMPYFPEPDCFEIEIKDITITAGSDLAFANYLFRLITANKQHDAAQTWIRATICFKKQQGKWKVLHEHGSVPFNPHTLQAMFSKDPDGDCELKNIQ